MTQAVEDLCGDRLEGGIVVVKHGHGAPTRKVEVIEAAHPVPDAAGQRGAERLLELLDELGPDDVVLSLISGGETTVTLRGAGKGGRNQEFALAAAWDLAGLERVAILSAGTDGTDGPTDAAGALVFGDTLARAAAAGLDADRSLCENDAYPFFQRLGDLIVTGPTGTNVMDIHLVLVA